MNYRIRKTAEQLANEYYPIGQKGEESSGNIDQTSEVPEEINEEMETRDMEGFTPGTDNVIIDKMDIRNSDAVLAKLKNLAILLKSGYARDVVSTIMVKLIVKK